MPRILLDAPQLDGDGPLRTRIPVAKLGEYSDKRYGKFAITADQAASWQSNLAAQGGQVAIDYDHASDTPGGSTKAAAWIRGMDVDGDKVMADVEWTPEGADNVRKGYWRFISPTFVSRYKGEQGQDLGPALIGAALTNRPFLRAGMPAINLSRLDDADVEWEDGDPTSLGWSESAHPRAKAGSSTGGEFITAGSSGSDVKTVQEQTGAKADGKYGPKTEAAVRSYQKRNGLKVDGVVGHQTAAHMRGYRGGTPGALTTADRHGLKKLDLSVEDIAIALRDFSAKQRSRAADAGAALPDGSFPIYNSHDVHNAVTLVGKANDPAKARAHIISRAKAIGCTDCLPPDWLGGARKLNAEGSHDIPTVSEYATIAQALGLDSSADEATIVTRELQASGAKTLDARAGALTAADRHGLKKLEAETTSVTVTLEGDATELAHALRDFSAEQRSRTRKLNAGGSHDIPTVSEYATIAQALGLDSSADEATIVTKARELQASGAKTLDARAGDEGKVLLSREDHDDLKARAERGDEAARSLAQRAFDTEYEKGVSEGRIAPKQKDDLVALYAASPEHTIKVMQSAEKIVPTEPAGSGGGAPDPVDPDQADHKNLNDQVEAFMLTMERPDYAIALDKVLAGAKVAA